MSLSFLKTTIRKLVSQYSAYEIQCALADEYYKMVQKYEPDYVYIPKEKRARGEGYVEPETPEGRLFMKIFLGSRNLCLGMQKWAEEYYDEE